MPKLVSLETMITVCEEQIRETENVFTLSLSLSLSLSIIMLTALVLPLLHFCERHSGGLFHCGVTTNFIFILTIHISMGCSPGDVSEEPVT